MPGLRGVSDHLKPEAVEAVGGLDLRARFVAEGFLAGAHRSLSRGFSAEFAGHRRYAGREPARAVDWTVWARTNRLYVREFSADTSLTGTLVVDASASMGYGPGPVTKLRYAVDLVGALAYIMARQGDPVGLIALGRGGLDGVRPSARPGQLVRVLRALDGLHAEGSGSFADGLEAAFPYIRRRGIVVLASDLHPASDSGRWARLFAQLRSRGHDTIVFHVLDADEVRPPFGEPVELEDMETGRTAGLDPEGVEAYVRKVEEWRGGLARAAAARGVDYVPLDTGMPFGAALASYLARRAGH
ncbi:MAG: DUF58 domain-containing protein [Planctomycetota bacterium]|jgi:uncharacterized protein (DUF58 family)